MVSKSGVRKLVRKYQVFNARVADIPTHHRSPLMGWSGRAPAPPLLSSLWQAVKVNLEVKSVKDTATRDWKALEAKIAADIQAFKVGIAQREREAGRAEHTAERLEWEAGFAIDYAVASIEQAELAVLDAIAGRVEAEQARRAV